MRATTCTLLHAATAFLLASCGQASSQQFTEINIGPAPGFDPGYREFCQISLNGGDPEQHAVLFAFYGDYQNALEQATKDASVQGNPFEYLQFGGMGTENNGLLDKANSILNNPEESEAAKAQARMLIAFLTGPASTEEALSNARPTSALEYIADQAGNYHFTLINEAHYNSQHRNFTERLLQPLWEKGYRYLALEALSHQDTLLQQRGYPVRSTGYYTKDAHFGNLIREALRIGYTLISYETQGGNRGTARDRDQALNLYRQTLQQDKNGKVLVHAGYSHINELGDRNYEPMGMQLKRLAEQDILTVSQEKMSGLNVPEKEHHYYRYADSTFHFDQPTVFLNQQGEPVLDPISSGNLDIQVYHPRTHFLDGRPGWMMDGKKVQVPLPEPMNSYKGHLLRAIREGEQPDAVPVDQFVIDGKKPLILPAGTYVLQVVDCEGALVKAYRMSVNGKGGSN
ncbi:MAG: hypothetical protein KDD19_23525 [Phaeodactylibacter sp.]|nr:hypothetical protein [Phaeodactylibacter sp.]MCB9051615.1 hypothetical protein [Lewinellaceae bacterium]